MAWVCSQSLAGISGSNPTGVIAVCLLMSIMCCQLEDSATGQSLMQRNPTDSVCVRVCVCVCVCVRAGARVIECDQMLQ